MPIKLEKELKKEAAKKFPKDKKRQTAYVYGTINKIEKQKKSHK